MADEPVSLTVRLGGGLCLLVFMLSTYGVALVVLQGFVWLRDGVWISLPASYLFASPCVPKTEQQLQVFLFNRYSIKGAQQVAHERIVAEAKGLALMRRYFPCLGFLGGKWLAQPRDWLGLHKIVRDTLDDFPISAFCPSFFFIPFLAYVLVLDRYEKGRPWRNWREVKKPPN